MKPIQVQKNTYNGSEPGLKPMQWLWFHLDLEIKLF
jgi:hypothetical protein